MKAKRTEAMGGILTNTRARTATAVTAGVLTFLFALDPFGMSALVGSLAAVEPGDGSLSRSARVDAVVNGLDLDAPVAATTLSGSWDALPGAGNLTPLPANLPTEDELVVNLDASGGTAPVSYRSAATDPAEVDLGGLAVSVAPADPAATPGAVRLHVAGETETEAAGITGVLLDVTDASAEPTTNPEVSLTVSYATFAGLGGGDWASRLRVVWIPDCAPETVNCAPVPIETVNDPVAQTVTATVPVEPGVQAAVSLVRWTSKGSRSSAMTGTDTGGSLAVTAGASSSSGDWGATSLAASSTWGSGSSTGAFSWSLPLKAPPVGAAPAPQLAISYSSAASDGRTPTSNNQSGLIGEGFDLTDAYVERSYVPCADDEAGGNNVDRVSGDLCWGTENATLLFNGSAVELVKNVATQTWHAKKEDGSIIEHLTGAFNGGNENEYWKVTTTDGTQYFFGRGQRSASDTTTTNSAWTVPVYGNQPGEPCYQPASNGGFASSQCTQVWRWNLEYVVDPSSNSMTYFYSKEANKYVYDVTANTAGTAVSYISGGRLDRIEYGTRAGSEATTPAPANITLVTGPRCLTSLSNPESFCTSAQTSMTTYKWPDVPTDLVCDAAATCSNYSPVFFNRYLLHAVSSFAYDGTAYQPVNTWAVNQRFVAQGTGIGIENADGVMLVTTGITHTGQNGTSSALDDIPLPPNTFTYTFLRNRVGSSITLDALWRPRVTNVRTESGASVSVNYRTECSAEDQPGTSDAAQKANSRLCYPVKWAPDSGKTQVVDYFHKYVVDSIVEDAAPPAATGQAQLITGSVSKVTSYSYGGGAGWDKPTGAMVKPTEVTYSDFAGFAQVTTTLGVASESVSTRNVYFQGLGGTLTAGPAGRTVTATDRLEYRGQVFDTISLNGATNVSESISVPGDPVVTATSAAGITATRTPSGTSYGFTYDEAGAVVFRTGSTTTYDANSQVASIENRGNLDLASDNVCTTTTYAWQTDATLLSKHLVALPSRSDVVAASCSATPNLPSDLIASTTMTYDAFGRNRQSASVDPIDGVGYVVMSEVLDYDARGRPLRTADALGHVSTMSYQQSAGGLPSSIKYTAPAPDGGTGAGFKSTTYFDPLTGLATETVDANGRITAGLYDSLGRLLSVRFPQDQDSVKPSVEYAYAVRPNGLNSVVTKTLGADGSTQHTSVALYDGLLRPFQTQNEGTDAGENHNANAAARGRMVAQVYYDSAGRTVTQTGQWPATGAPQDTPVVAIAVPPSETTTEYDGAGRQIAQVFWVGTPSNTANEKWRTRTAYYGAETLQVPPMGGVPQSTLVDALGRTVELRQYVRDADTSSAVVAADDVRNLPFQSTTYTYDAADRRTAMRDPQSHVWSFVYNWAGQQTSATDPDAGTSTSTYDLLGRVATHTDANGKTLAYKYDALGRTTELHDNSLSGALRATWQYDTAAYVNAAPGAFALGLLASSTRYVGGQQYKTSIPQYDLANRPVTTTVTLPNVAPYSQLASQTFTTSYKYTADGQVASVALPAVTSAGGTKALGAEIVTTRYDTASMPSWMSGGFGWGTYVAESRFTSDGKPLVMDLGNTYGEITSYRYEDGTNRLLGVALDREGVTGTDLNVSYTYDAAGNVTSQSDRPTAAAVSGEAKQDNQCLGYDGLARLTVAWTAKTGDCAVAQNAITPAAVNGGIDPYWSEYEYDLLGNRTKLVQHDPTGGSSKTTTYVHGAGAAGPHQLTSAVVSGSTSSTTAFTYDTAGNRKTAGTTNYTWDAEGELSTVGAESNVYDASGNRLVRTDATATTVYLPGGQEVRIAGTAVTASRYYSFAGATVATRTGGGMGAVTSLVSGPQGSPLAAVPNTAPPTATPVTRIRSDPFGGVRGGSDAGVPGDHRFLGATRDSTGLTLLGARYYDEVAGVFVSVDPLLDPAEPSQFNAYQYSGNNPLTFSDPSGMMRDPIPHTAPSSGGGGGGSGYTPSGSAPPPPIDDSIEEAVDAATKDWNDFLRGPDGFFLGTDRGADGLYRSQQYAPQLLLGYGDYDDWLFDRGEEMEAIKVEFTYDEVVYVVWLWKGDYAQLGAGTEAGFYIQKGDQKGGFQYYADPLGYNPKTSVTLGVNIPGRDDPIVIGSSAPENGEGWNALFCAGLWDLSVEDISAKTTVDFSDRNDDGGMFAAFKAAALADDEYGDLWKWGNGTATINWRRRRQGSTTTLSFEKGRGVR